MVYFCCINVCIPCWYLFFVGGIWHGPVTGVPQSSHGPKERFPWSPLGGLRELELKTNQPATEKIVVSGVRTSCFCQEKLHVKLKGPVGFLTDSEPVTFLASHFRSLGSKVPNWLAHYALPKDRNGGVGILWHCAAVLWARMGTFGTTSPTTLTFISTCRMPLGCDGGWLSRRCPGYREPLGPCLGVRLYGE